MARRLVTLLLGVGVLAAPFPILAHHSVSAEFDTTKVVKFTGKVVEVAWGNPHIYTHVEAMDPDSKKTVIFKVEGGPPNALFRQGWRKDTLKIGETVTVSGNRAKNPASMNVGQATIITSAGQRVYAGQNQNAAQP